MKPKSPNTILKTRLNALAIGLATIALSAWPANAADDGGLVKMLTTQLGVTDAQASGGAGTILGYAKDKLGDKDFKAVSDALPETKSLLAAAPKTEKTSALGSLGSSLGGAAGSALGLASLGGSFKKLGLSSDMIGKFVPIVMSYAQSKGGDTVGKLLGSVLEPKDEKKADTKKK